MGKRILTLKDSRSLSVCGDFKLPEYKFKNTLSLSLRKCEYPIYPSLIMLVHGHISPTNSHFKNANMYFMKYSAS